MAKLRFQMAMSLDGFSAGPGQDADNPIGIGGMQLHQWAFELKSFGGTEENASDAVKDRMFDNVGAVVMGRNMFGPIRGDWGDESWKGWWGDDPPYHVPVFVLTHHARGPLPMEGGTTFNFVTDGIESALDQAFKAADGKDVLLGGGASVVRQYLKAGLIDEFTVNVAPVILGSGERLLGELGEVKLEQTEVIEAPGVTHLSYRVLK